jgi:AraC-like DNA-binding protein
MLKQHHNRALDSHFLLAEEPAFDEGLKLSQNHLKFIWNRDITTVTIIVDGAEILLKPNQILCCTYVQKTEPVLQDHNLVILLAFNKAFYCIHTNDAEVSCNGLLFFGSDYTPIITLNNSEQQSLNTLINVLTEEFDIMDGNQEEMLRILLKRFIIKCTRLARQQLIIGELPESRIDIIRQFNVLVEEHFKERKQISDYAALMNRSPKTITNVFSRHSTKTPLQVIHDRIILEARRLLIYTECSAKEIAYQLGFDDPSQFSRFFKNNTRFSIQEFREKYRKET